MPSLQTIKSDRPIKTLFIGDSTSGKTGALASLAAAGYNLRILDFDNGISSLTEYLTNPNSSYLKSNPQAGDSVRVVQCTDEMKAVNGKIFPRRATAWAKAVGMLEKWKDGEEDFGSVTTWTTRDILVIDSLTKAADAALNYHLSMNAALGQTRTQNEARRDIGAAQNYIRDLLKMLYADAVSCNVIVISHITVVTESGSGPNPENKNEASAGYPSAIGRALSPHIPSWFDSMLIAKATGGGQAVRRKIYTTPQIVSGQVIGAKNVAPLSVKSEYPLETGLAEYFEAVRGPLPNTPKT